MLSPPQRHCGIQMAAALIFACTVMNLTLFVELIDELWTESQKQNVLLRQRIALERGQNKVCVFIPGDGDSVWNVTLPSMAASVKGDTQFTFGVVIGRGGNWSGDDQHVQWFQQHFPAESTLDFVSTPSNESAVETVLYSVSLDGCSFYFIINNHTEFLSPGWAHALMRALQNFSPPFVGAVSPAGCKDCIFVRELHREIFSRRRFRLESCWAEWVRSVYGTCRVSDVAGAGVHSIGVSDCPANKSALFSDLVSRGRLFVSKFLSLGSRSPWY